MSRWYTGRGVGFLSSSDVPAPDDNGVGRFVFGFHEQLPNSFEALRLELMSITWIGQRLTFLQMMAPTSPEDAPVYAKGWPYCVTDQPAVRKYDRQQLVMYTPVATSVLDIADDEDDSPLS